jgi:UDPglucose 6-dehydrogenase
MLGVSPMKDANIVVVGVGRIGAVTAVGLAHLGLQVTGFDRSTGRVRCLQECDIPEAEPGLRAALRSASRFRTLQFTTTASEKTFDIAFICVDTPPLAGGVADLSQIFAACQTARVLLRTGGILITRSTVPVGTGERITRMLSQAGRGDIDVVHMPEFLREGRAWEDFREPDRVVIGAENEVAAQRVASLFTLLDCPVFLTNRRTAELAKYAANAYLATSISYANEMSDLAQRLDVDASAVFSILRADRRIGQQAYLTPGLGFGGHCLPKDTAELEQTAHRHGILLPQLAATRQTNARRPGEALNWLRKALGNLDGTRIALLGIAFKAGTDDLRESPSLRLASDMAALGITVVGFDPLVESVEPGSLTLAQDLDAAVDGADAIVIAHGWQGWREIDPDTIRKRVARHVVYDAPGVLDIAQWREAGFLVNRPLDARHPVPEQKSTEVVV